MPDTEGKKVRRLRGQVVYGSDEFGPLAFFVLHKTDSIQRFHHRLEFYEREDLEMLSAYLTDSGVILDVGANVGNHTVYLARRFPNATVVPFEMFPRVLQNLRCNVALNDLRNVDLSHLGVAAGADEGFCKVVSNQEANLGLVRAVLSAEGDTSVVPLDSVCGGMDVSFVKIDVEGNEMNVLRGLSATIERCRPVMFVEVDKMNYEAFFGWVDANAYEIKHEIVRYKNNKNYLVTPT